MEVNEMTAEECRAVLEYASLGRLGCSYKEPAVRSSDSFCRR